MSAVIEFDPRERTPANLEAEQALLGAVLYDNEAFHAASAIRPEHFREAFHGRLWAAIAQRASKGVLADPTLLASAFVDDQAFAELGGVTYLANLVDRAPPSSRAKDYAAEIVELANARGVLSLATEAAAALRRGEPASAAISQLEAGLLTLHVGSGQPTLVTAHDGAAGVLADLDAPESADGGISTGLAPLDDHLGQLLPDDLILLAGRPGMGKSGLGSCISLNVAKAGVGVIEVNSEMTVKQMMRRHLTDLCFDRWGKDAPTYKDIRRRRLKPGQRQMLEWAAEQIGALPLAMVKQTGLTLSSLRSLVRRQAAQWSAKGIRLGLISVDHVGLLKSDAHVKDRYTEQTELAIGMKALADELHIPVLALVQLNREVEKRDSKRPQLSDLRDTGAWEENADTVIGMYRDAYYALKEPEPKTSDLKWNDWDVRRRSKVIEAILLKVREGEEGVISLWASIGHNAIRGADPEEGRGFL